MTWLVALSGGSTAWYISRATGVVTLGFLSASVLLGILTSFRWSSRTWPRFVVEFVHRNVSLLVLVFLALHVVTVVADGFAPIRWIDVVVPFVSSYRPLWLGFGAIALDLLLALVITSLLRHRIGYTAWRIVHWSAYACWPIAVLHGLGTGSDSRSGVVLVFTAACVVAVLVAATWRVSIGLSSRSGARALGLGAIVLAPVVLVAWLVSGPLADGWARRAGTPVSALGASNAPAADTSSGSSSAARSSTAFPASGFDAMVQGALHESPPGADGDVTLSLAGALTSGTTDQLDVELTGTPLDGGGVSMRSGLVTVSDGVHSYQGAVVGLGESQLIAHMSGPGGAAWEVGVNFTELDQQRGTFAADVHATQREQRGDEESRGDDG